MVDVEDVQRIMVDGGADLLELGLQDRRRSVGGRFDWMGE